MSFDLITSPAPFHSEVFADFRRLSRKVAELGSQAGVRITPYRDPALPHFARLEPAQQRDVVAGLSEFVGICEASLSSGHELKDSRQLLWSAIRRLGLKPPSQLFDHLADDDIIEIHSRSRQLFRNFEYFDYCSYSLEELSSIAWTELYRRPESMESDLLGEINRAMDTKAIVLSNLTTHVVEESFAPLQFKIGYRLKLISPLFIQNSSTVDHYLVCVRADLRNGDLSESEEEKLLTQYYGKQDQ